MGAERDQMLSHYRLVEKIGSGGMGVVWKAEDTVLRRTVAIKVLPPDLALDEERRHMFLDEARLAASMSHAHIAQVYELGREGNLDFIAMEYVEGQPLSCILRGRPLPAETVSSLGLQVAQAMSRAHHKGLLHRDLKPGNILVTPDGDAKVVDFGLATLFERRDTALASELEGLTATDSSLRGPRESESVSPPSTAGTLLYMSPEQMRGERLDARSDIFSLGTVLYEMTTGQKPFRGTTRTDVAREILESRPSSVHDLVPNVPLDLDRIIHKSLQRRPGDRYQTMDDMVVDLKRLGRELESGASISYGDLNPARSSAPTPARRILVLGSIGVMTIALLAWVVASRRGRDLVHQSASAPVAITHERSAVAVLPFQNLSADGPHAYFVGGLQEELLTQLAKVAALKVISRTSVMGYQGTSKPLKTIATELGVGSVVEGSVQVVGERLRVNVQLIDAATDEHLWAEHYDRTLDDAFAIQSEVAQQIVAAVGAALTGAEQGRLAATPTVNAEAYRLYLQGREYYSRPGFVRQNFEIAQRFNEEALGLDPKFAQAHAVLSQVHGAMYWWRYDPSPARAERQREEAEAALRLAPDLPQAHIAMGLAHYWGRRDYRRALDEFAIALTGLPNDAELWRLIGYVHRRLGNWDKVFAAFEKAKQLNPRDWTLFYDLGGLTCQFVARYADAVRAYDQALRLAPDLYGAAISRGWTCLAWQGQLDTLRAVLGRIPSEAPVGNLGSVAVQRAELLLWERDASGLLQMLQMTNSNDFVGQNAFVPSTLYAAWAHQLRGDERAARAAFDSARVLLDAAMEEFPDDWRVHAARGLALAGLGHRDEARQEAWWLQQSAIYREDAFEGPRLAEDRAQVLAQAGDADAALDEIERLLAGPSNFSVHALRLDPRWDPIRDQPRFKALLAKYSSRPAR